MVAVDRRAFPIDTVLERVCRDHRDDAQAKGVALSHVRCRAWIDSDPTLVERIARNLVANAVRYTDAGRIVVGCRRRRGGRLALQVWDTGRGIPAAQHERVFHEYYQLGNPERDRSQGLGLGLAIVRRLTHLIGATVRLHSAPGWGSCFEVGFARAPERPAEPLDAANEPDARGTGLVVVIDDEAAIRLGMSILLSGWGYEVVTAGSVDEAIERLATHTRRPGLLLCDFRLRGGETGIDAIQRLRTEYNEPIPAMLISGDTAAERLHEVQASELLLLHKPVPNDRLRTAIARLIVMEPEEG